MNSRIVMTPRARAEAKRTLIDSYSISCHPSGEVTVRKLAFSDHPRDWHISAKVITGPAYVDPLATSRRANVHLHACVSPVWLTDEFKTTLRNEATGFYNLICGSHPLPAPEGIDLLELICASDGERGTLVLRTRWHFRFTVGNFSATVGVGTNHPAVIRKDIEAAHAEFRLLCAKHLAARLNPKPKLMVSGDGGPTPADWATHYCAIKP
jgi:hypothetical protein